MAFKRLFSKKRDFSEIIEKLMENQHF